MIMSRAKSRAVTANRVSICEHSLSAENTLLLDYRISVTAESQPIS